MQSARPLVITLKKWALTGIEPYEPYPPDCSDCKVRGLHYCTTTHSKTVIIIFQRTSCAVMATCNEFNSMTYWKWFKRPDDPSLNWSFTEDGTATIEDNLGSIEGFTMDTSSANDVGLQGTGVKEDIASLTSLKSSPLDSYLRDISEHEAKFPNTTESKLIFETLDKVVLKMSTALDKKAKLFQDCSTVRVGSSAEGLKSGSPNEFDYNIILPRLSEYVGLEHSLHNNSLNNCINATFFPNDIGDIGAVEEDSIYFNIEDFDDIIDDVLPKSEMANILKEEIDDVGEALMHGVSIDEGGNHDGWSNVLAPFVSMPQRSILKVLFKALEKIIEDTLRESLVPELSILPKKSLREFRNLNQIAITSSLLWHGTEFPNLEISIDFALMIPMKKQPMCYDLPMYLHVSQESILPMMIPLQDTDKIFHYIIRSYKSCRLSTGIAEAKMISKIPSNSKIKQSIRICKKLRDLMMTHYFDIATETVCPILQSYWIKTVAMYVFRLQCPCSEENEGDDVILGKYIIEIFTMLQKCLTGDEGKRRPFLSSFNVPFKNLLHSAPKVDEEVNAAYLDDEEKEIMCRGNFIAANDIKRLLEVIQRFNLNEEEAIHKINKMKQDNEEAKSLIYREGMREKLGILLFQYFELEDSQPLSTDEKPYFMEFAERNFPNMQIKQLEEQEVEEIEYCSKITTARIRLVEDDEVVDLEEMFTKAWNRCNFFGLGIQQNITSDHYRQLCH